MTRGELPALRAQLAAERRRLRDVVAQLRDVRDTIASREPTTVELMACAGFLHNVYNGIENCLLRVAHAVDESVPTGSESHRLLLDQMSAPLDAIRPAVIDDTLVRRVDEYRRFRRVPPHVLLRSRVDPHSPSDRRDRCGRPSRRNGSRYTARRDRRLSEDEPRARTSAG